MLRNYWLFKQFIFFIFPNHFCFYDNFLIHFLIRLSYRLYLLSFNRFLLVKYLIFLHPHQKDSHLLRPPLLLHFLDLHYPLHLFPLIISNFSLYFFWTFICNNQESSFFFGHLQYIQVPSNISYFQLKIDQFLPHSL
jgi:hypothetical protein